MWIDRDALIRHVLSEALSAALVWIGVGLFLVLFLFLAGCDRPDKSGDYRPPCPPDPNEGHLVKWDSDPADAPFGTKYRYVVCPNAKASALTCPVVAEYDHAYTCFQTLRAREAALTPPQVSYCR